MIVDSGRFVIKTYDKMKFLWVFLPEEEQSLTSQTSANSARSCVM